MIKKIYINKIIAVLLVCTFAISVTPVIVLHDIAANHKDVSSGTTKEQGDHYSKYRINCHCVDFVAESPFINDFIVYDPGITNKIVAHKCFYDKTFSPQHQFLKPQRGPPSYS
ncbi:MAG: hypothetical protein ABI402_01595 [Ferruginibacter sp.]